MNSNIKDQVITETAAAGAGRNGENTCIKTGQIKRYLIFMEKAASKEQADNARQFYLKMK